MNKKLKQPKRSTELPARARWAAWGFVSWRKPLRCAWGELTPNHPSGLQANMWLRQDQLHQIPLPSLLTRVPLLRPRCHHLL